MAHIHWKSPRIRSESVNKGLIFSRQLWESSPLVSTLSRWVQLPRLGHGCVHCVWLALIAFIPHPHNLSTHPTPSHTHSGVPPDSSGSVCLHHQPSRDSVLLLHLGTEQTIHYRVVPVIFTLDVEFCGRKRCPNFSLVTQPLCADRHIRYSSVGRPFRDLYPCMIGSTVLREEFCC